MVKRFSSFEPLESRFLLTVSLFADLNSTPAGIQLGDEFAVVNETAFFPLRTKEHGEELWKTDGTAVGTQLVKDLVTGVDDGSPSDFVEAGGRLFFKSKERTWDSHGSLWVSDGTPEGTVPIRNPKTGELFSVRDIASQGDRIVFSHTLSFQFGRDCDDELWVSDGTTSGTRKADMELLCNAHIAEVGNAVFVSSFYTDLSVFENNGLKSVGSFPRAEPHVFGDRVWVTVETESESQLWNFDEEANATMVASFDDEMSISFWEAHHQNGITSFRVLAGNADPEDERAGLWVSDGTEEGTRRIAEIEWRIVGGIEEQSILMHRDGRSREIWARDLAAGEPEFLFKLTDHDPFLGTPDLQFTTIGGTGYFVDRDATNSDAAILYSYDSDQGVQVVRTYSQGITSGLRLFGDRLLYSAGDEAAGVQLRFSDGTDEGTGVLLDLSQGNAGLEDASDVAIVGDHLVFRTGGINLSAPVFPIKQPTYWALPLRNPGSKPAELFSTTSSFPWMVPLDDSIVVVDERRLWSSDLTESNGVVLVDRTDESFSSGGLSARGNGSLAVVSARSNELTDLWFSDGTEQGTRFVEGLALGDNNYVTTVMGDVAYIIVQDSDEIWRSDGTTEGTFKLADVDLRSSLYSLSSEATDFYFAGIEGRTTHLWKSDGTTLGTERVDDFPLEDFEILFAGSDMLFITTSQSEGDPFSPDFKKTSTLWAMDSNASMEPLAISNEVDFEHPFYGFATTDDGGVVFYSQEDHSVWRTDGKSAGTEKVVSLPPGMLGRLELIGNTLFVAYSDSTNGSELWEISLSTGEHRLYDLAMGEASSDARLIGLWNDELFFLADDQQNGLELWVATPTAPLVGDIDGDGEVGFGDFLLLSENFGRKAEDDSLLGDLDLDGQVGFADFLILSANFGKRGEVAIEG